MGSSLGPYFPAMGKRFGATRAFIVHDMVVITTSVSISKCRLGIDVGRRARERRAGNPSHKVILAGQSVNVKRFSTKLRRGQKSKKLANASRHSTRGSTQTGGKRKSIIEDVMFGYSLTGLCLSARHWERCCTA